MQNKNQEEEVIVAPIMATTATIIQIQVMN